MKKKLVALLVLMLAGVSIAGLSYWIANYFPQWGETQHYALNRLNSTGSWLPVGRIVSVINALDGTYENFEWDGNSWSSTGETGYAPEHDPNAGQGSGGGGEGGSGGGGYHGGSGGPGGGAPGGGGIVIVHPPIIPNAP